MATIKSDNPLKKDSDPAFIHKIVSWSQADVDKYLIKNGILGCGPVLAANSIDGVAFLSLNYQSLTSWAIPIIKRSKIVALLNDLGTESYRKDVVVKAHISMRLQQAIGNIEISHTPKGKSPGQKNSHSATIKPNTPRFTPIIPPKPGSCLSKKPFLPPPPPRNFQTGETTRMDSANENNVNIDESDYLVPIPCGTEESFPETVNSRVNSFNSDRGTPLLVISSDSFTDTDDEGNNGSLIAANDSTSSSKKKKMVRKPGFIKNFLFSSKTNLSEEKVSQADPLGTPPLPPVRNQDSSRWSSESSLSQSGSESQPTPPPQMLQFRKISSPSATSMSSLAESFPSPTYPPPPVPTLSRRIDPFRRKSPASRDSSPFLGSRTASPCPPSPRLPSTPQGRSPMQSPCSSDASTESETPKYAWFFNVDRRQAESLLRNLDDGTFLIRPSKHGGDDAFYTLSLQSNHRVFHILIRRRPDGKLALGSEKEEENAFHSLNELVQFHFDEAMQLHSSKHPAGLTRLSNWPANIA